MKRYPWEYRYDPWTKVVFESKDKAFIVDVGNMERKRTDVEEQYILKRASEVEGFRRLAFSIDEEALAELPRARALSFQSKISHSQILEGPRSWFVFVPGTFLVEFGPRERWCIQFGIMDRYGLITIHEHYQSILMEVVGQ